MKRGSFYRQSGFSLIELLVVISMIGILASILVPNYLGVRSKGRDTQRKADLLQIQTAMELYRSDNDSYPASLPACDSVFSSGGITYMQKLPCDPMNTSPYLYAYQSVPDGSAYTLAVCLENVNDKDRDATNNPPAVNGGASITTCDGGDSNWSYTLFSP